MHKLINELTEKMEASIESCKRDLARIRTGRASINLLDGIKVMAYGSPMPLNQVGSVTIPESRLLVIQPWDTKLLPAIEKAIFSSDLGLNPSSDGKVIRINIPQLTEERRKELVKNVRKTGEEHRVAIRNLRREAIDVFKKLKNNKEIAEDDFFRMQEEAQHATDKWIKQIDEILADKEKEVMSV